VELREKRGTLYGRWREVEEMQINRKQNVGVLHNGTVTTIRRTSISERAPVVYDSSAAASAPSSFSAGLSESCISEVQSVRLSRSSCIMRVESL